MNLIDAWNLAKEYQELHLIVLRGGINVQISVTKKGSFFNAVRQLVGHASDTEILSDRWAV